MKCEILLKQKESWKGSNNAGLRSCCIRYRTLIHKNSMVCVGLNELIVPWCNL